VDVAGGHSSQPSKASAIGILSEAVARVEQNQMPTHLEAFEETTQVNYTRDSLLLLALPYLFPCLSFFPLPSVASS
jgi:hypothetical protein